MPGSHIVHGCHHVKLLGIYVEYASLVQTNQGLHSPVSTCNQNLLVVQSDGSGTVGDLVAQVDGRPRPSHRVERLEPLLEESVDHGLTIRIHLA